MTHLLQMQDITKTFPGVKALDGVNLDVKDGEIHAVVGENGAGKSTLMKVLSGVYPAGSYDGDILFEGETVRFRDIRDSEDRGIIIIHQELALIPQLSIAENIFLGNERARKGVIDWHETNRRTEECWPRSASTNRRQPRSIPSASASNSWSRSQRHCPRTSNC
jgi:putative multiple sugar transport system ATP-binding protein